MNPAVGIDLGTTNTVVAVQTDDTGPRVLMIPQPGDERRRLEPRDHMKSAVFFEAKDSAVVGAFAAGRLDSFKSIKSRMGTRWRMGHPCDSQSVLTPAYISAHILKLAFVQVKKDFPHWDGDAIVTVPASFNTDQRKDTLLAARYAGFSQVRLLDEPTAAFYYYFDQNRDDLRIESSQVVLVFDFGGGTLDVSIIRVGFEGSTISIDPVGRSRYNNLGGDDIDADIAAFLLALWEVQQGARFEDLAPAKRKSLAQLFQQKAGLFKEEAEDYLRNDIALNEFAMEEDIGVAGGSQPITLHKLLSRGQYEEVSGRYFSEKSELNIFRPIREALDVAAAVDPSVRRDSIHLVLYTGGASRMAGVKAALDTYFAPRSCYAISDEEACHTVAIGAAACRYDEMHSQRGVSMRARLLECILTRDDVSRRYVTIVPLTCEPAESFALVDFPFRTPRPLVTLKVPLFRGVGPNDHHLAPMQDLMLRLPHVVDEGVPYELLYRMTADKTIELRAVFRPPALAAIEVIGEVAMDSIPVDAGHRNLPLARVNAT